MSKKSSLIQWLLGKDTTWELERMFTSKKWKAKVNKVKVLYR